MGYYQGDFYRGDPGFFSMLGRVGKGIFSSATGMSFGGFGGRKGSEGGSPSAAGIVAAHPAIGALARRTGQMIARHPVLSAAAAAGTIGLLGAGARKIGMHPAGAMGGLRGHHISKRTGALVKNRRMRVTNPRALRRAIRRATGFAHLARKVLRFTSPRAPRGRAVFKARRRKK